MKNWPNKHSFNCLAKLSKIRKYFSKYQLNTINVQIKNSITNCSNANISELSRVFISLYHSSNFFIMSTEFDKNISEWRYDCTDQKNGFDFFMRLVKWPKIAVKKCQNLIFKVNFQCQKPSETFKKKGLFKNINLQAHFLLLIYFFCNFNFWNF